MSTTIRLTLPRTIFAAIALVLASQSIAAQRAVSDPVRLQDPGFRSAATMASSDGKVIVGSSEDVHGNGHAVMWQGGTAPSQDIGTLGGHWSRAEDLSADGKLIVGWAYNQEEKVKAVIWQNGATTPTPLGTAQWMRQSRAMSVSTNGKTIVGWAEDGRGNSFAVVWPDHAQAPVPLDKLANDWATASGISVDGKTIIGTSTDGEQDNKAVIWLNNEAPPKALRAVSEPTPPKVDPREGFEAGDPRMPFVKGYWSRAEATSADGSIIVGGSEIDIPNSNSHGDVRATLWRNKEAEPKDLGTLGGDRSYAWDVSNDGKVIVGWAYDLEGEQHAVVWLDGATKPQALKALEGKRSEALGVSANGKVILGRAEDADGHYHAVAWFVDSAAPSNSNH